MTKPLHRYLLTALSALLVVLSFSPWDAHFLIWLALVPWLYALSQAKAHRERLKHGILFSFLMTMGGFYWIAYALHQFGAIPWFFAVLGLVIFCIFGQPQFWAMSPLIGWIMDRKKISTSKLIALITTSYIAVDYVSPRLFLDTLGYSLYKNLPVAQWAEVGGPWLLTGMILFFNTLIYQALKNKSKTLAAIGVVLAFAVSGSGALRLKQVDAKIAAESKPLNVAVIQANIGDVEKLASERGIVDAVERVIGTYLDLSKQALSLTPKPQAIIWPETAYPSLFGRSPHPSDHERERRIKEFARLNKIPLFFGGYDHEDGHDFNTLFFMTPDGSLQNYHKTILLPFAEYIPGFEHWDWFRQNFPQMGFFGRGPGPSVIEVPVDGKPVRMGPLICYEGLFPSFTKGIFEKNADFHLNVTNDSWFGPYGEPYLHLQITSLRAIETRTPFLRATNTGITVLLDAAGRLINPTPVGAALAAPYTISMTKFDPTLYVRFGDWWVLVAALIAMGMTLKLRKHPK